MPPRRRTKGRIRKLPSGRFQAGYIGPDAVVHYAPWTFTAKIDAEGWLASEIRLIEQGDWSSPAARQAVQYAERVTVAEYTEAWIAGRDLAVSTRRSYESTFRTTIAGSSIAGLHLTTLSRQQITAWWRALPREAPRARSKALALLVAAFNTAVDDGLIEVSPVRVKDPKAVTGSRPRKLVPVEAAQLQVLEAAMPERLRLGILLAAWGGLRYGELAALRRCDFDLRGAYPVLHISRSMSFASGQDNREKAPKTEAGIRDVNLPSWLKPIIAQHLLAHAQPGDQGLVFQSREGGILWPSAFYRQFHRARQAANLPDLRVHDLRHHAAVRAAQAGETFSAVQARLGHASPKAALRYQHASVNSDRRIAEALDRMREIP